MTAITISPKHPWLAPLAGYTDLAFRLLCREQGAAVACTEMVSAKGLVYGQRNQVFDSGTLDLLAQTAEDSPLVVQLFGEEAEFLAEAVTLLRDKGFTLFDLNMGCAVPKVIKTGAGAAMLQDIEKSVQAVEAMVQAAGDCLVGCKLRSGWHVGQANYLEFGKMLQDAGTAWLTLHPRYAKQHFAGVAHWEHLRNLRKVVDIPVIASGDLFTATDAIRCVQETGVDSVMFARGAIASPGIFAFYKQMYGQTFGVTEEEKAESSRDQKGGQPLTQTIHDYANHHEASKQAYCKDGEKGTEQLSGAELHQLILRHAKLAIAHSAPKRGKGKGKYSPALLKMRTIVPQYVRGLAGAKELRQQLVHCESWESFHEIVEGYFIQFAKDAV